LYRVPGYDESSSQQQSFNDHHPEEFVSLLRKITTQDDDGCKNRKGEEQSEEGNDNPGLKAVLECEMGCVFYKNDQKKTRRNAFVGPAL